MKTRGVQIPSGPSGMSSARGAPARRPLWRGALPVLSACLLLAGTAAPSFSRQSAAPQNPGSMILDAKCVIGFENINPGAKGKLTSLPTGLEFKTGKKQAGITTSSIQDIFTGRESRQDVGGMSGTLVESAIPYGGGRFVSLFSHKVDVLTVEYADSTGGFHGAIFVLSAGKAEALKSQLIAQGAKVSTHVNVPEPGEGKP